MADSSAAPHFEVPVVDAGLLGRLLPARAAAVLGFR